MTGWTEAAAVAVGSTAAAAVTVRLALAWLRRRAIMDRPNDRSSHAMPTPRGGGLGVTPVVLAAWAFVLFGSPGMALFEGAVLGGAALLAVVSWADDRRDVSPYLRLVVQAFGVAVPLVLWPQDVLVFQGFVPLWLDRLATAAVWIWFINLYNFMDGIDGITGVETAAIGVGVALVAVLGGAGVLPYGALGLAIAGAALGFLVWNWPPARVFLGDVGSVPLGYLLGWTLLVLAAEGQWAAALLLPAYHLTDATLTLGRRIAGGQSPFRAHREHFYQKAVHRRGMSHAHVTGRVAVLNLVLVVLALWTAVCDEHLRPAAVGLGFAAVAVLLTVFAHVRR